MAGLSVGRIVAGGLEGLGAAGVEQARMKEATRFQAMLENLRSSNQRAETSEQYDLMDRNTARQTDRQTDKELIVNRQQADLTKERDVAQHGREIEIIGIRGDQAKELTRIQSALSRQNTEASARLGQELESGQIRQIIAGEDGYYAVRGDGTVEPLGVMPQPKGSGSTSTLDALRNSQQPAQRGVAQAAPASQVERPESKTYSQAEAQDTAKQYGMSVDQVHRKMRELGYKLTN